MNEIEVQGNNGGSYIRIEDRPKGMCYLEVGETCVVTIQMEISVSALAAMMTLLKDEGFENALDRHAIRGHSKFKIDKDHWTLD